MVVGSISIMLKVSERCEMLGGAVDHIVFSSVLQVNTKGSDALDVLVPDKDALISPERWPCSRQGDSFDVRQNEQVAGRDTYCGDYLTGKKLVFVRMESFHSNIKNSFIGVALRAWLVYILSPR